jgi:hypothetical protein
LNLDKKFEDKFNEQILIDIREKIIKILKEALKKNNSKEDLASRINKNLS